jgi:hypothetical protein
MNRVAVFMAASAWSRLGVWAGAAPANTKAKAAITPANTPRTMLVSSVALIAVEMGVARIATGVIVLKTRKQGGIDDI